MTVEELQIALSDYLPRDHRVKGLVRHVNYIIDRIRNKGVWSFDVKTGTVQVTDDYSTGTLSVTNGSATITGSGTTWTSGMVGRKIDISGVEYEIGTFTSTTSLDLTGNYMGGTASGLSYTIYQNEYSLASDVKRLVGVRELANNRRLIPVPYAQLKDRHILSLSGGRPIVYAEAGHDSSYNLKVALQPYPDDDYIIEYVYYKSPDRATGPSSTIDMPADYDELILEGCIARVLRQGGDRGPLPGWREAENSFRDMLETKYEQNRMEVSAMTVRFQAEDDKSWANLARYPKHTSDVS